MFKKIMLMICLLVFSLKPNRALAEFNPKVKAVLMMAAYGTIGGARLGTATLAFNTTGRSVAKGASIGLYAGLFFGSFIIISYKMKRDQELNPQGKPDYYPDTAGSPYETESGENGDAPLDERKINLNECNSIENYNYQKRHEKILFYVPLMQINF